MTYLLRQYVPDSSPPRPQGRSSPEAIAAPQPPGQIALSKSDFEKYAEAVLEGLKRLRLEAYDAGIDFEAALREISIEERRSRDIDQKLEQDIKNLASGTLRPPATGSISSGQKHSSGETEPGANARWLLAVNRRVLAAYEECREDLTSLRDARLAEYAKTWEDYLAHLEDLTPVAAGVRSVWASLQPLLWAPEAAPTEEGFRMVWDRGAHHLQVEVLPDGLYDWFYRNRETDETSFEEGLDLANRSEALQKVLSRLTES